VTLLAIGSEVEYRQVSNATLTALISGTGDIFKTGAGSLTLATNTSLAGNIAVLEGSLVVNNQMVNIDLVRVNGLSAVLKGSGTLGTAGVSRGIDVELGVLSPGNSAGILTTTSLDLSGSGTAIEWELMGNTASGRGTSFDGIDLNGDLTIASGSVLDLVFNAAGSNVSWFNSFWDTNQSWVMIDGVVNATVAQDVFTTFNLSNDSVGRSLGEFRPGAGFTAAYDNVNGEVVINYTAAQLVPEPSTLILAAAAGLGGLAFLRRRRRAAAE
jgi:autotransporter-associated beta strand protein